MNDVEFIPKDIVYPGNEKNKLNELEKLFQEWYKNILTNDPENAERMVFDGFYPYYTHQKVKILFIAKESLGLYGKDYIQAILPAIRSNDPRGRREWNESHPDDPWAKVITNNTDPFLSKMLYIAYGLNNACCSYDDMPWASDIGQYLFGRVS